jgi:L-ascorbate metabolism protein UlaG (beta-lactamase superfamily)
MRLTKFGHACVRVEHDGVTLVIDPGVFTEPTAMEGADAVLVTHDHVDHFVEDRLRAALAADPALRVWTNRTVAGLLDGVGSRVSVVGDGDTFAVDGVEVEVHGELHAVVHPDLPRSTNIGFLVAGQLFHPGDAFTVPERPVPALLLPVHGPWSKTGELIDWVRAVKPEQAIGIHDGALNDVGLTFIDRLLGDGGPGTGARYTRLAAGDHLDLP